MSRRIFMCAAAGMLLLTASAWAAGQTFETSLDPAPFDASTKPNVQGAGKVSAVLDGRVLTITGSYSGLPSNATIAHVNMGLAMGVLGDPIGDLKVSGGTAGEISGKINLSAKQLAGLRAKSLYIRLDSEKAPDGNLQGWLEPAAN
jgi:hypothetical protein